MALMPSKVAQVAILNAKIEEAQKRVALLMEHIRAEAPAGSTIVDYKDEKYVVKATPKEDLDAKAFQAAHPFAEFPEFYKTDPTFSAALVKGDNRKGFTKPGTTAISIEKAN